MTKPLGLFGTHHGVPAWASFGEIAAVASDEELRAAAELVRRPFAPFAWVLSIMGYDYTTPLEPRWVEHVRDRFAQFGVPITAIRYGEEWYPEDMRNRFAGADAMARIRAACAWVGSQQATIKAVWPHVPIVGIAPHFCDVPIFGPDFYAPVPAHTDILAVEAYVPAGLSWDDPAVLMEAKLAHVTGTPYTYYDPETRRVVTSQRTEPVVIIPQAFRAPGDPQWGAWPTDETVTRTARWVAHPRVIAVWPFDWASYQDRDGATVVEGWRDWPESARATRVWGMTT